MNLPIQQAIQQLRNKQAQVVTNIFLQYHGNISDLQRQTMCYMCIDNLATVQNQLLLLGLNDKEYNDLCNKLQEKLFLLAQEQV